MNLGGRNDQGQVIPLSVKVGDKVSFFFIPFETLSLLNWLNSLCQVLLPEYGGTKIEIESKEYTLFREQDIVAKLND